MHSLLNVKYILHLLTPTNTVFPEDGTKEKKNVWELNKLVHVNFTLLCVFQCISNKMQLTQLIYIWKLLYRFRVVSPPIIKNT